nr:hypothetical protein Iba_scaffold7127CG0090 [Ipomoea batatas]
MAARLLTESNLVAIAKNVRPGCDQKHALEPNPFLANIASLAVAFLGGTRNAANGVNILTGETLFVVEYQERSLGSGVRYVFGCDDEFQTGIHSLLVLIILRILHFIIYKVDILGVELGGEEFNGLMDVLAHRVVVVLLQRLGLYSDFELSSADFFYVVFRSRRHIYKLKLQFLIP